MASEEAVGLGFHLPAGLMAGWDPHLPLSSTVPTVITAKSKWWPTGIYLLPPGQS